MSASPPQVTQSTKRPLEEASSPSRATDQPEAKRPALDKVIRSEEEIEVAEDPKDDAETTAEANGDEEAHEPAEQPEAGALSGALDPAAAAATVASTSATAINSANAHDEAAWIHIRAVISSPEAATIIGKGGENVSNIRKMSNAKCTVSDYQKGAVERILTVSGIVDAVAKV